MPKSKFSARLFLPAVIVLSLVLPHLTIAAGSGLVQCGGPGQAACRLCDLVKGVSTLTDYMRTIMVFIALAVLTAMGILYIVSAGNEGTITRAKDGIRHSLAGVAIILFAWLIVNTVMFTVLNANSDLGVNASFSIIGGFSFDCDATLSGAAAGAQLPVAAATPANAGPAPINAAASNPIVSAAPVQSTPVSVTTTPVTPFLSISPTTVTFTSNTDTQQLTVYFTDAAGVQTDVTASTTWSNPNTSVVLVGISGIAEPGSMNGIGQVTASYTDPAGVHYSSVINIGVNILQHAASSSASCTIVGGTGPATLVVVGQGFPNDAAGIALFDQQVNKIQGLNKPPLVPSAYTMYRSDIPDKNMCGSAHVTIVITNRATSTMCYGGGGYVFLTSFQCVTESILAHELGHAIGNLADEYLATNSAQTMPAALTPQQNCVNVPATPSSAGNAAACNYFNTNFGSNQCFQGCYFGPSEYRWRDANNDLMNTASNGNQFGPADKALITTGLQNLPQL